MGQTYPSAQVFRLIRGVAGFVKFLSPECKNRIASAVNLEQHLSHGIEAQSLRTTAGRQRGGPPARVVSGWRGRAGGLVFVNVGRGASGGTSSGAICAFNVAWERPDQFRKVISCIGSFTDIRGGHVFPKLVRNNDKKPIRIFLEDTLHDNPNIQNPNRDWHVQNEAMLAALTDKGYDVKHSFADGGSSTFPVEWPG